MTRWVILPTLLAIWIAGTFLSARYLLRYEKTPGQTAGAPIGWPAGVAEPGDPQLPTLVVALHPRCSCSRASLSELEKATESFDAPFNALLLVYQSANGGTGWQNDELYSDVQRRLHARVVLDTNGALAARFGAGTSGEVLLYSARNSSAHDRSAQNTLLYAGGVTGARGMNGDNPGAEALVDAFQQQRQQPARPVFGCGLSSFESSKRPYGVAMAMAGSKVKP